MVSTRMCCRWGVQRLDDGNRQPYRLCRWSRRRGLPDGTAVWDKGWVDIFRRWVCVPLLGYTADV